MAVETGLGAALKDEADKDRTGEARTSAGGDEARPPIAARADVAAGRLRIAVARMSRWLRPTSSAGSLTATEVDLVLVAVKRGPASMSDMATFCGVNPTMLSRMVPRLVAAGLLERHQGDDRRVSLVQATPQGRRLVGRVLSERDDALSVLMEALTNEERRALAAATPVLERLADTLRAQAYTPGDRR